MIPELVYGARCPPQSSGSTLHIESFKLEMTLKIIKSSHIPAFFMTEKPFSTLQAACTGPCIGSSSFALGDCGKAHVNSLSAKNNRRSYPAVSWWGFLLVEVGEEGLCFGTML